ncbi:LysR family transcriptional regulator [Vibrio hangzhouensis]|uniref:DNA-binding transcriptional regulator, LysR family n=1 Tax=Vibrio hangzhouensis TaxID=462991 RepID=A0A1H6B0M6_9VIBR|nr:LysR family transcriptional regulator [Vibrio hangzhouensis]SEG54403.1 DNA-binding transcriptional regulator, LysR family [Vibrio hangzhouensis]
MYSFEQLKIFVAVCEHGSFSAAARKLKRAQSGVSQAVANLEIAIDQTLFSRDKNIPQLTENGKALLPIARSILNQQKYFDQKVDSLSKDYEHELTIAVDESLMDKSFLKILAPLAAKFPITNFELICASTFDVERLVREQKAQMGIVYADGELKVDMDFFVLGQARFLTVVAPEHELASLPIVKDSDLKSYCQCVHRSSEKKELWFTYGISSNIWYANDHKTLVDMVSEGIGWSNLPEMLLKQSIQHNEVVVLPVAHEKSGWVTTVGCLVSRSHSNGPVLSELIELLQKHQFIDDHWE